MRQPGNKTRFLILGLLSEEPLSGYEIKRIVDARFSHFWNESFGQIYPELARLEGEGLVEMEKKGSEGGKERKVFSITPAGLDALKSWLAKPVEKEIVRFEILLKLYFSNLLDPTVMIGHIREFEMTHRKQQEMFNTFEKEIRQHIDMHDNHEEVLMVLHFGQKVCKAYGEWCAEVLQSLGNRNRGMEGAEKNEKG